MPKGDNIKVAHRKVALQNANVTLRVYDTGVEFDVHIKSDTAFVHAFVPTSHKDMAEMFAQWFRTRPKEEQEQVLAALRSEVA